MMLDRIRVTVFVSVLVVLGLLVQATPLDVNGDRIVGPHEVIDLAENWKGDALQVGGVQPWQFNGSDIFFYTGKVGIGSATPHHQLRISSGPLWTSNGWAGSVELDNAAAIGWQSNDQGQRFGIGQTNGGLFFFRTADDPGTATSPALYDMVISDGGLFGVGGGPSGIDRLLVTGGDSIGTAAFGSPAKGPNFSHIHYDPTGDWYIRSAASAGKVILQDSGGAVGIGTQTPTHKLEIVDTAPSKPAVRVDSSQSTGIFSKSTQSVGVEGSGMVGVLATPSGPFEYAGLVAAQQTGELAARFDGKVVVLGELTKSSGAFRIDHPLDPGNKYLSHSFIESPDMMNIYNGNVVLDDRGEAEITLPDWFMALNKDFRYQLTPIGGPGANLHIAQKMTNGRFRIGGGSANLEVSWQVTGIRQDAWAKAHPVVVEEDKPDKEKGTYLAPELFGQPKEKGIHYRPDLVKAAHEESIKNE